MSRWRASGCSCGGANQYLEERKPWQLAKNPEQAGELDTTLWSAAEATRIAGLLLAPFIPSTSDKLMGQLGLEPVAAGDLIGKIGWGSVELRLGAASWSTLPQMGRIAICCEQETKAGRSMRTALLISLGWGVEPGCADLE